MTPILRFSSVVLLSWALLACGVPSPEPSAPVASAPAPGPAQPDAPAPRVLTANVEAYRDYLRAQVEQLQTGVAAFADAVIAGDVEAARRLYAPSRQNWERIEPVAELFPDLDTRMDARADDFKAAEHDPEFTGWHRIEYALYRHNSLDGMAAVATQLRDDAAELQRRIDGLSLAPGVVVGGAAELIEEVAATKISGEENRYSGTDLWDLEANADGARTIVELFREPVSQADPALLAQIDASFATLSRQLDAYRRATGWASYGDLTERDRNDLKGTIVALAEQLAQLRGTLGLD